MSDREEFEEKFPVPLGVKWCERQQDYTYENYRALDSAASYSGKWQAYRDPAQSQGVPEIIKAIADKLEKVEGESADGGYMWDARECAEFIREEAAALLSTPAAPQADEWVKCADRLPTEADGYVWLYFQATGVSDLIWRWDDDIGEDGETHWKPTGLTRPQPPEQGACQKDRCEHGVRHPHPCRDCEDREA